MTHRPPAPVLAVFALTALLLSPVLPEAAGQSSLPSPPADSTLRGVVWTPPAQPGPAVRALRRMVDDGVTALRLTRLPPAEVVWSRADSLGLSLFVDLPVSYVRASALDDSLRAARPLLDRLRRRAARHPSLRGVGLARGADTTVPAACDALRRWSDRVQAWGPEVETYYLTPFAASHDRCAGAVDRVLVDLRARSSPRSRLSRWTTGAARVGVGALGTWVRPGAAAGLRVPHSPEQQARALEDGLRLLLRGPAPPPLFVHRWQDPRSPPIPARRYGLHTRDGTARPAARVLEGFYRGSQRVFAFSDGTAPTRTPVGPLLLAWGLIGLLGGLYARNPFVRQTLSRYFAAPGFYRDALRKGRDVGPAENALLLGVVGGALGVVGTLAARVAAAQPATGWIVEALPAALRSPIAAGLSQPALAGLAMGGVAVLLLLGWAVLLVLAARVERPFRLAQGIMLVTWPCWPAVLGMMVALVAATQPPLPTGLLGLILLGGGLATTVAVSARVLRDYWSVSGVELPWIVALTLPSPLVVLTLLLTALLLEYDVPLRLLWHLATRT